MTTDPTDDEITGVATALALYDGMLDTENDPGQYRLWARWLIDAYLAAHADDVAWHLELFVPGRPAPQGSKRFLGPKRSMEMSKYVGPWRDDVRAACLNAWACTWSLQDPDTHPTQPCPRCDEGRTDPHLLPPLDGPLVLEVEFIRKRPAAAPKSYTPDASTQPDLSKLVRSTEDALTSAGVWADDARVVRTVSSKRCAEIDETPGAHIRIGRLTPARELWEAKKATTGPSDPKQPNEGSQTRPKRHRPPARSAAASPTGAERVDTPANRENGSQSLFSVAAPIDAPHP